MHNDSYKIFKYESPLGNLIEIWNAREGKVPATIKKDNIQYQIVPDLTSVPLPKHKPKDGDLIFLNLNNKEIEQLIEMQFVRENQKLGDLKKPGMNRRERRDYEKKLWNHYLGMPVVKMFGKKPEEKTNED